jgi:hypothetical protein
MLPFDVMIMKSGAVGDLVDLIDLDDGDIETSPGPALSGITIRSDGGITSSSPPPSGSFHTWLLQGSAADYDVKVVPVFGTFSSGNTSLWENLGTSRTWTLLRSTPGQSETQAIIYIKLASGSVPIAQATLTLTSTIEF